MPNVRYVPLYSQLPCFWKFNCKSLFHYRLQHYLSTIDRSVIMSEWSKDRRKTRFRPPRATIAPCISPSERQFVHRRRQLRLFYSVTGVSSSSEMFRCYMYRFPARKQIIKRPHTPIDINFLLNSARRQKSDLVQDDETYTMKKIKRRPVGTAVRNDICSCGKF